MGNAQQFWLMLTMVITGGILLIEVLVKALQLLFTG